LLGDLVGRECVGVGVGGDLEEVLGCVHPPTGVLVDDPLGPGGHDLAGLGRQQGGLPLGVGVIVAGRGEVFIAAAVDAHGDLTAAVLGAGDAKVGLPGQVAGPGCFGQVVAHQGGDLGWATAGVVHAADDARTIGTVVHVGGERGLGVALLAPPGLLRVQVHQLAGQVLGVAAAALADGACDRLAELVLPLGGVQVVQVLVDLVQPVVGVLVRL